MQQAIHKEPMLGVIGGLGPETSAAFCLNVIRRIQSLQQRQPRILLENVPLSFRDEQVLIEGGEKTNHRRLILQAANRLSLVGCTSLVIPCNTAHLFIEELRNSTSVPFISILEESVRRCHEGGRRRIGVLASTKTLQENLHAPLFSSFGISLLFPRNQHEIDALILRILKEGPRESDKKRMQEMCVALKRQGAERILLACTELSLVGRGLPDTLDSLEILEEAAVRHLSGGEDDG